MSGPGWPLKLRLYTGLVPATDLSDGVHLNVAGSQKVAERWFAALEPLFKP